MRANRLQILLTLLGGLFLATAVVIIATFALAPDTAVVYRPALLTAFVLALFVGLVCITWLLRGLLRPYNQLIGEARRAPVAHSSKAQNEAAFVLETFQAVVAQLQNQQQELQRLTDQASQRADTAERFSDRIVASMPTGLMAFDSAGKATVVNQPAAALFSGNAVSPGSHYRAIFSTVPLLAGMVESCLETGRVFRREEIEMANGEGTSAKLGATVAPIDPASEHGSRGVLCLITDITEVTRLREQVALKRNLESLGEMSAGLAHEFKNAMAALHGYAQLLQTIEHDEQSQAAANALIQEVRNLSEMTTSFLNFARPQTMQVEEISLNDLIDECVRELQTLFESRQVVCLRRNENGRGKQPINVRADPRLLRQALLNLLRNAAEAIPVAEEDRRVTINSSIVDEGTGRWAAVTITDTGPGIPESDLQKIFIPFFTTKAKGHGIGLALAHRVITEHGGSLSAVNSAGRGAVFSLRLPALPPGR